MANISKEKEFLAKLLVQTEKKTEEQDKKLKLKALAAIKSVLCKEFKLDPKTIEYKILPLDSSDAICDTIYDNGKVSFVVNVDEGYFRTSSYGSLIVAILHEWGHVRQSLIEERGGKKLEDVDMDESKLLLLDKWQTLGFNFRYEASDDEYYASVYALNKANEWLSLAEKLGVDAKIVKEKQKRMNKIIIRLGISRDLNTLGYKAWKGVNKLFNIEEESSVFSEVPENMTEEEFLYNSNSALIEETGELTKEEIKSEIRRILTKAKKAQTLHLSNANSTKSNDEKLYLTSCYLRLLAKENGLNEREIAINLGTFDDLFNFRKVREEREDCPLYGILDLSVRNMNMLTTFEYASILKKNITCFKKRIDNEEQK